MKRCWKEWIKAAAVRAVKTVAQTAVALIGTGAVGFTDLDWMRIASAAGAGVKCGVFVLPEAGAMIIMRKNGGGRGTRV